MHRTLAWRGTDAWRAELAEVELLGDGVRASGIQLAADPEPYRLDYRLDALDSGRTRRLEVRVAIGGRRRGLDLRRDRAGWSWTRSGDDETTSSAADAERLEEAVDCDLGLSPLTNLLPVRREGLAERDGELDLVCAWVSVPDLAVLRYPQRYEHVRRLDDGGAVVRFVDRGPSEGFVAELALDSDGLVIEYPGLASREGQ